MRGFFVALNKKNQVNKLIKLQPSAHLPLVEFFGFTTNQFVTYYKPLFMKPLLLLGCSLLAATAAHTQFSLLPYAGFEQSRNTVGNAISASEINGNLKAGLKMLLQYKGGHTPFLNFTTSPAPVQFSFDNAGSLLNSFQQGGLRFRLEGGYQYNSKPIFFGKKTGTFKRSISVTPTANSFERKSCGAYSSHCGARRTMTKAAPVNNALNMRLQPSLALAYVPAAAKGLEQSANGFTYTVGSWKTALVPALGFAFAKGASRLFTLGVFYTHPFGQKDQTVTSFREGKTYVTNLQPQTSTWGLSLGLPLSFGKSIRPTKAVKSTTEKRGCNRTYYHRCMRLN